MPAVDRIVVDRAPWATRIAFLASGEVVDLWVESADRPSLLGGIALARVLAVNRSLATATVAIPGGEAQLSDRPVVEGERLIVQVARDAFAGKRAVARAGVELAAGPVVLTPRTPGVGLSSQIGGKARRAALRAALSACVGDAAGLLVRSAGAAAATADLVADAGRLAVRWRGILARAGRCEPPCWLEPPVPLLEAARAQAPGVEPEIDDGGGAFEACGAADALETALGRRVALADGGALVVDAAEAATLIDVDLPAGGGREDFRRVNEAAGLAALRQIRLRGLRGVVLVDLPRMKDAGGRRQVLALLAEAAAADPVPTRVLGWTAAGLLEIVREGTRRPLADGLLEAAGEPRPTPRAAAWAALAGLRREAARIGRPRLCVAPAVARWLEAEGAAILQAERARLGHLAVQADPALAREAFRVESED